LPLAREKGPHLSEQPLFGFLGVESFGFPTGQAQEPGDVGGRRRILPVAQAQPHRAVGRLFAPFAFAGGKLVGVGKLLDQPEPGLIGPGGALTVGRGSGNACDHVDIGLDLLGIGIDQLAEDTVHKLGHEARKGDGVERVARDAGKLPVRTRIEAALGRQTGRKRPCHGSCGIGNGFFCDKADGGFGDRHQPMRQFAPLFGAEFAKGGTCLEKGAHGRTDRLAGGRGPGACARSALCHGAASRGLCQGDRFRPHWRQSPALTEG